MFKRLSLTPPYHSAEKKKSLIASVSIVRELNAKNLRRPALIRLYASGPLNGAGGGFPGFRMQQQERQKGEALKEYVSTIAFETFNACS